MIVQFIVINFKLYEIQLI